MNKKPKVYFPVPCGYVRASVAVSSGALGSLLSLVSAALVVSLSLNTDCLAGIHQTIAVRLLFALRI